MNVAALLHGKRVANLFDRAQKRVLDDEGAGATIGRDIDDLAPDQAEVDRHGDQPGFGGGGIDLQPLDAVVGEDRDPVALLEPETPQRVGQPARARIPRAKGHPALEIGRADPLGIKPRVGGQDLAKIQERQHRQLRAGSPHQTACLSRGQGEVAVVRRTDATADLASLGNVRLHDRPVEPWASPAVTARPRRATLRPCRSPMSTSGSGAPRSRAVPSADDHWRTRRPHQRRPARHRVRARRGLVRSGARRPRRHGSLLAITSAERVRRP